MVYSSLVQVKSSSLFVINHSSRLCCLSWLSHSAVHVPCVFVTRCSHVYYEYWGAVVPVGNHLCRTCAAIDPASLTNKSTLRTECPTLIKPTLTAYMFPLYVRQCFRENPVRPGVAPGAALWCHMYISPITPLTGVIIPLMIHLRFCCIDADAPPVHPQRRWSSGST